MRRSHSMLATLMAAALLLGCALVLQAHAAPGRRGDAAPPAVAGSSGAAPVPVVP